MENLNSTEQSQSAHNAATGNVDGPQAHREQTASQDSGYEGDVEVVKPYAIEEPDDHSTSKPETSTTSYHPRNSGQWQSDLVESMGDLQCESDNTDRQLRQRGQKRGKKRKPPTVDIGASAYAQSQKPENASKLGDIQYKEPSLSPKRPRRRGERPNEDGTSSHLSSGTGSSVSSSSGSQSPESNSTGAVGGTPAADAMDID
ncbi:hypothetical protein ASPWEDRAFT_173344 [Aspergillus wentii DTO 134E9]|uniref:Uncharacterized protein n=1 Tax=Aspergillus wentii DTO 134E9 TaxID=1073089 RepID=A0A1L9RG61_ASPWE|nr:uncharacterized protein ASPWEDRAFT_173344 [Aspergillus wentii DTO 134E9]KAI9927699.1 hypothetical protein MW887_002551 [Aspergillus wentii]OJJ33911.1 hypothetical protein ASPWEDRAFT_173344 [Aspergillus wentii DTO 134E9]